MLLNRREVPVLVFNVVYISIFAVVAVRELNVEFVLYTGVVIAVGVWLVWKQGAVQFGPVILWGLTGWGLLHLAGGNLQIRGDVLYNLNLIAIWPKYHILRYDQVVHVFGFGVATLVCHHLLQPYLRNEIAKWGTLSCLLVLMGSGIGAMNEIVEFVVVMRVPETNVGGYDNTLLDLLANMVGGVLAVGYLAWRRGSRT